MNDICCVKCMKKYITTNKTSECINYSIYNMLYAKHHIPCMKTMIRKYCEEHNFFLYIHIFYELIKTDVKIYIDTFLFMSSYHPALWLYMIKYVHYGNYVDKMLNYTQDTQIISMCLATIVTRINYTNLIDVYKNYLNLDILYKYILSYNHDIVDVKYTNIHIYIFTNTTITSSVQDLLIGRYIQYTGDRFDASIFNKYNINLTGFQLQSLKNAGIYNKKADNYHNRDFINSGTIKGSFVYNYIQPIIKKLYVTQFGKIKPSIERFVDNGIDISYNNIVYHVSKLKLTKQIHYIIHNAVYRCVYNPNVVLSEKIYNAYKTGNLKYIMKNYHVPDFTCVKYAIMHAFNIETYIGVLYTIVMKYKESEDINKTYKYQKHNLCYLTNIKQIGNEIIPNIYVKSLCNTNKKMLLRYECYDKILKNKHIIGSILFGDKKCSMIENVYIKCGIYICQYIGYDYLGCIFNLKNLVDWFISL